MWRNTDMTVSSIAVGEPFPSGRTLAVSRAGRRNRTVISGELLEQFKLNDTSGERQAEGHAA
jgi:hypothetical protein